MAKYKGRVDWHGVALALNQLKELSAPSKLDEFYAKKESDMEQFEIQKEYEQDKIEDSRKWEMLTGKIEAYADKYPKIIEDIETKKQELIAIDGSLAGLAGEHVTPGAENVYKDIDVSDYDTMLQTMNEIEGDVSSSLIEQKRLTQITDNAHMGKSIANSQTEDYYVSPESPSYSYLQNLDPVKYAPIRQEGHPYDGHVPVREWDLTNDGFVSEDEFEHALQNLMANFSSNPNNGGMEGFETAFRSQIKRKKIKEDLASTLNLEGKTGDNKIEPENMNTNQIINALNTYDLQLRDVVNSADAIMWADSHAGKAYEELRNELIKRGEGHKMNTYEWDADFINKWASYFNEDWQSRLEENVPGMNKDAYNEFITHSPEFKDVMQLINFWEPNQKSFPQGGQKGYNEMLDTLKDYVENKDEDSRRKYLDKIKAGM